MVDKKKPHGDYKLIVFYLKVDYYLLTYKTMEILMIYWVCYSDAALLTILLFSYRSTKIIDFLKADQNRLNFDQGLGNDFSGPAIMVSVCWVSCLRPAISSWQ